MVFSDKELETSHKIFVENASKEKLEEVSKHYKNQIEGCDIYDDKLCRFCKFIQKRKESIDKELKAIA